MHFLNNITILKYMQVYYFHLTKMLSLIYKYWPVPFTKMFIMMCFFILLFVSFIVESARQLAVDL